MNNNKDITFIRVKGRIVPIKRKKPADESKKLAKQSAGFTLAGVGLSAGAGKIAAGLKEKSRFTTDIAMDKMMRSKGVFDFEKIARAEKRAKRIHKFSLKTPMLAQVAGGALLSQGFQRALRATGVDITNPVLDVASELGSQLASALIARSIKKRFKI